MRKPLYAVIAEFFATASRGLAVALGLTIPLSTTATQALLALLLPCWLLSGDYAGKFRAIRGNKVAVWALAMFGVYTIGVTYSTAPLEEAGLALLSYRKLLYLAVLVTVFARPRTRNNGIRAFQLAMLITLVASFLMSWGLVQTKWGTPDDCAVFKNRIAQNTLMAFFVALLAYRTPQKRWLRWLHAGVMLLAAYNVLFMVLARTGYLVLFALVCLFMFQRKGLRGLAVAGVLVTCLAAVVYGCSSGFRQRVNLVFQEARDYYQFRRDSPDSSIGQRLAFYRTSALIARQHPVLGTGTGSFRCEFQRLPENQDQPPISSTHNEYLSVLVQTGLLGLGVFFYWLHVQWTQANRLPHELANLAQAIFVTFVVGSLFNSLISNHTGGYLFCYFTALCHAGVAQRAPDEQQPVAGSGAADD